MYDKRKKYFKFFTIFKISMHVCNCLLCGKHGYFNGGNNTIPWDIIYYYLDLLGLITW